MWELHAAVGFSISLPRSHLPSLNPWDTELTCLSSRNWTIKKKGGLRVIRLSCSRDSCGCIRSETRPIENFPRYILTREQNTRHRGIARRGRIEVPPKNPLCSGRYTTTLRMIFKSMVETEILPRSLQFRELDCSNLAFKYNFRSSLGFSLSL